MPVWQWSGSNPNLNGSIDSTINFSEGQAPSTYNDSNRAVMAAIANWYADMSGILLTSGTGSIYTLTSRSGYNLTALSNGVSIRCRVHATNNLNPTLNLDSTGNFPIYYGPGLTQLDAGVLSPSGFYTFTWLSNTWSLNDYPAFSPGYVPIGGILPWAGGAPPSTSYLWCNGVQYLISTYPKLFAAISNNWGGDGINNFQVPNLCEVSMFGRALMGGAASRSIIQGSSIIPNAALASTFIPNTAATPYVGEPTHTQQSGEMFQHAHGVTGLTDASYSTSLVTEKGWVLNDPGHTHPYTALGSGAGVASGPTFGGVSTATGPAQPSGGDLTKPTGIFLSRDTGTWTFSTSLSTGVSFSIGNAGGTSPTNNIPASVPMGFIIRAA